ncbi:hypothetical protein HMPREF0980_01805 [Dorea sp. D27]|nr:hypothetical protein HMPREF0980_01805 [Dorea sp. D27]
MMLQFYRTKGLCKLKRIVWYIQCELPAVLRHCKSCGTKREYRCSGQFRVNAQRKHLDIWLIYRCPHCDATWNLPICSRISSAGIDSDLLERYHNNDWKLAAQHALNMGLLRQNGAIPCTPAFTAAGENPPPGESVELHLMSEHPLPVKVSAVLRQKLNLSRGMLNQLIDNGTIKGAPGINVLKQKLDGHITVTVQYDATGL